MKLNPGNVLLLLVLAMVVVSGVRGDGPTYAQIVLDRESLLKEILAVRERQAQLSLERGQDSWLADDKARIAAQLALYSFRRDVAATAAEQLVVQEQVVAVYEKALQDTLSRMDSRLATYVEVLEAKAPLLAARQLLEELRMKAKKPSASHQQFRCFQTCG
ncbi:MAG: hypothetical protein U1F61_16900 [Opitutaceae bacterium]